MFLIQERRGHMQLDLFSGTLPSLKNEHDFNQCRLVLVRCSDKILLRRENEG